MTGTNILGEHLQPFISSDMRVSDMMTSPWTEWNEEMIVRLFPRDITNKIISTNPQGARAEDTYSSEFTKTDHYTVKSGYWVQLNIIDFRQAGKNNISTKSRWLKSENLEAEHKLKDTSLSIEMHQQCPPNSSKHEKQTHYKRWRCMHCSMESETINHILFECPYARLV